jgi:hypothetical protein
MPSVSSREGELGLEQFFAGYEFERVGAVDPERDASGEAAAFRPQSRYANARNLPLNAHGAGPFCRFVLGAGDHRSGVYVLTLNDDPVYAGKCVSLARRWGGTGYGAISPRNCFVGGQSTNCRVNNHIYMQVNSGGRLCLWFHAALDPGSIERELILSLRPSWNEQIPW